MTPSFRRGIRAGIPVTIPLAVIAISFGSLARSLSWGILAPTVMSVVVFSGSAQFAVTTVLNDGGSLVTVCLTALFVNARFIPMGLAVAPSLKGGRIRRAIEGQTVVDAGWVAAARPDGTFDRHLLFGFFLMMVPAWVGGTLVGALFRPVHDIRSVGLDAVFPMFFLALLIDELRERRTYRAVAVAATIALLLTPITPAGVPIVVATLPALVVLGSR
jgi:4-azaleucine resistance transporter AzlC